MSVVQRLCSTCRWEKTCAEAREAEQRGIRVMNCKAFCPASCQMPKTLCFKCPRPKPRPVRQKLW